MRAFKLKQGKSNKEINKRRGSVIYICLIVLRIWGRVMMSIYRRKMKEER
jgi:hypothetical protein